MDVNRASDNACVVEHVVLLERLSLCRACAPIFERIRVCLERSDTEAAVVELNRLEKMVGRF